MPIDLNAHLPGVSRVALGCMHFGARQAGSEAAEVAAADAAVRAALDAGINLFDHADIYVRGRAESIFGAIIKNQPALRDRMYVQTKCGLVAEALGGQGDYRYDLSRQHIMAAVDASLARLQTGWIDLLLLHRPDPLMQRDEVAEAFTKLRDAGKVRHFGVSNMRAAQLRWLQKALGQPLVANQMEMSLLSRHWLEQDVCFNHAQGAEVLEWSDTLHHCMDAGVQLQAWGPLAQGRLSGASQADAATRAASEMVAAIADELGVPREAVVLGWLMHHPAGIQPVIGSADPQRIRACAAALDVKLTREHWYALYTAARGRRLP